MKNNVFKLSLYLLISEKSSVTDKIFDITGLHGIN